MGRILETDLPENFGFCLCDENQNGCAQRWSHLAGTLAVPNEVFFEKVKEAQIEKYGRILNPEEVAVELQDGSSFLSKLAKSAK